MISTVDKRLIQLLATDDTAALSRIIGKYTNYVATVIHNQLGAFASQEDTEKVNPDSVFSSFTLMLVLPIGYAKLDTRRQGGLND